MRGKLKKKKEKQKQISELKNAFNNILDSIQTMTKLVIRQYFFYVSIFEKIKIICTAFIIISDCCCFCFIFTLQKDKKIFFFEIFQQQQLQSRQNINSYIHIGFTCSKIDTDNDNATDDDELIKLEKKSTIYYIIYLFIFLNYSLCFYFLKQVTIYFYRCKKQTHIQNQNKQRR